MSRLLAYILMRIKGLGVRAAWLASNHIKTTVLDYLLIAFILATAFYILHSAITAERYYALSSAQADAYVSKVQRDHYEQVLLGCLAVEGIIVNGINHECKIREYKNG